MNGDIEVVDAVPAFVVVVVIAAVGIVDSLSS